MNAATATATEASLRVPFVRLDNGDPELMRELLGTVADIADRSAFTLGAPVQDFEEKFADWCGTDFCVGVSSGTAALELALRALGIGAGDEVVVPTNSFIATAEAVSAVGATPVLVDVDEASSVITAAIVEAALTPKTRCVIPVHLYGRTVEMGPLADLCRANGIYLVEDACQAHGSIYEGRRAGAIGDVGCFSFYPTKNLGAWGDGGALVTDDEEIAAQVALLRSHGEGSRHHHQMPARTDRLDALPAALLSVQLDRPHAAPTGPPRRPPGGAPQRQARPPRCRQPEPARRGRDVDRGARRDVRRHPG